MRVTYFKRFRMEADLREPLAAPELPPGYRFVAWDASRLAAHAEAKHHSFRDEIDSEVFECLADVEGCHALLREIANKPGFLAAASWLVEYTGAGAPEACGTVQGVQYSPRYGGIQNVGVTPWHRHRGIGSALVVAAMLGFRAAGLDRAFLEVTAENVAAVRLYETLGFRRVRTSYRPVELASR
ncbi:MAG: GNAT family N-acetyltransferase [Lacipirellulaceae bacterium]